MNLDEQIPNITLIPQPGSPPPENGMRDFGPVDVSDDVAATFLPHLGLCDTSPLGQCYLADISVDGKVVGEIVLIKRSNGETVVAMDWIKFGAYVSYWFGKQVSQNFTVEELPIISREYITALATGMAMTKQVQSITKQD